jgi:aromatic ring-cleaving dioxygenase
MRQNCALVTAVPPAGPEIIRHYHAHVYYDPVSSRGRAARLRERVAAAFPDATLGRWHDAPVGPHPQSMYQIAFPTTLLASFLPWLMLNRDGLNICSTRAPARVKPSAVRAACTPEASSRSRLRSSTAPAALRTSSSTPSRASIRVYFSRSCRTPTLPSRPRSRSDVAVSDR